MGCCGRTLPTVEIDFVKIQKRVGGSFLVTIPSEAVKALRIVDNDKMKVLMDREAKRVIFELVKT
jgi:antitoxin component of MazEF toxin-antitoxin module